MKIFIEEYVFDTNKEELKRVDALLREAIEKSKISDGIAIIYAPHTTAAITINENGDPDVKSDILFSLSCISPDRENFKHYEGNSDAHVKSSLIGASETVLIKNATPILGTWQSVYFCEFDGPRKRKMIIQIMGI